MPTSAEVRYVIVTPARDEKKHIADTIEAVCSQTILPLHWVIVNDGSSDRTGEIAESYARSRSWITVVHRADRGARKNGAGVVETFYEGYGAVANLPWEFLVKLDADLTFGPDYFERSFAEFRKDQRLGIGGGALYHKTENGLGYESHPGFHVRGATKMYRRECWEQIDGIWRGTGWDTLDEVKANMLGWTTRTFTEIHAMHHRLTGAAEGRLKDNIKNGRGSYAAGYHPLFLLVRSLRRMRTRPWVLGSLGMMYGFASAYLRKMPRVNDARLIHYIQQQQLNKLLGRPSIWQ